MRSSEVTGWTMFALSLIFLAAFAWTAAAREWEGAFWCAVAALVFAWSARSEWEAGDE